MPFFPDPSNKSNKIYRAAPGLPAPTQVSLVATSSEPAAHGGDYVIVAENPPSIAIVDRSIRRISAFPYWREICKAM